VQECVDRNYGTILHFHTKLCEDIIILCWRNKFRQVKYGILYMLYTVLLLYTFLNFAVLISQVLLFYFYVSNIYVLSTIKHFFALSSNEKKSHNIQRNNNTKRIIIAKKINKIIAKDRNKLKSTQQKSRIFRKILCKTFTSCFNISTLIERLTPCPCNCTVRCYKIKV